MTSPLHSSVTTLQSSLHLLTSSISILDSSVSDFPRLAKVLQTTRVNTPRLFPSSSPLVLSAKPSPNLHPSPPPPSTQPLTHPPSPTQHFELLPEPTLHAAQATLASEIAPQIDFLLTRVATHLDRLERRAEALKAKAELQEGRLQGPTEDADDRGRGGKSGGDGRKGGGGLEELRVRSMRQRKERLSYAVERLTLQAQQRERQLRMSVARGEGGA